MAFFLSCSNRIEALQQQLAELLRNEPLPDPFRAEVILVPSVAIKRWLNLQIAVRHGVAANIEYPLPASWIWQVAASANAHARITIPPIDPLSREQAAWKIFGALPSMLPRPEFDALQRYLSEDESGVKRWQLSQRIADVFDRYQYYRPDWIRSWSKAVSSHALPAAEVPAWQPELWRALITQCEGLHRVALMDRFLMVLESGDQQAIASLQLPTRLCCFALSSLPPLFVQVFRALSAHVDIGFFQHSPTDQYWADLRSKKAQARQRVENPMLTHHDDTGNELLASWGRQGQAFQDLLLEHDLLEAAQWEDFPEPGADTLLHRLQNDILALKDGTHTIPVDDSIRVSICHSPLRECQVLHDQLLHAMEKDPTLAPEDILVIVPEISRYAASIEAVFRRDERVAHPRIPWNLSDITVVEEHPLIQVFFQLLALPGSRFAFSEVMSILEVPRVAEKWGLDLAMQDELHALLQASEVRWGLSPEHKLSLGLPATPQNTWSHALDRLLAAYALGDEELWRGIAPQSGATGSRAQALGRFIELLSVLDFWRVALQKPRTARAWQVALSVMLEQIFGNVGEEEDRVQQIRDVLDDLQEQSGDQSRSEELSNQLLTQCLTDSLGTRTVRNRFFSGGVTFCGMRPMRSLPFRMICILGLNDAAFPRRDSVLSFDAMATHARAGDPRKGDEDRYLMLETLLCARQSLYLSYTGRSLADNSVCQPSVLLRELLDYLDARFVPQGDGDTLMSVRITREQPMQAFSWRHFAVDSGAFVTASHDAWWCKVASALQDGSAVGTVRSLSAWPTEMLAPPEEPLQQLELGRLARFLEHPVKAFFNTRLRIYLQEDDTAQDDEVFTLDGLQSWQVQMTLAASWMQGDDDLEALQTRLVAQGVLPHGSQAALAFQHLEDTAQGLWTRLEPYRGSPVRHVGVDLRLELQIPQGGAVRLTGQIKEYRPGLGLLHFTPSRFKGKHLVRLWVEHLALCAAGELAENEISTVLCSDESLQFPALPAAKARAVLADYVALYVEGLQRPLPLFPTASFVLCSEGIGKAETAWEGSEFTHKGDRADPCIELAQRGCHGSPVALEEHHLLANRVYGLAWQIKVLA